MGFTTDWNHCVSQRRLWPKQMEECGTYVSNSERVRITFSFSPLPVPYFLRQLMLESASGPTEVACTGYVRAVVMQDIGGLVASCPYPLMIPHHLPSLSKSRCQARGRPSPALSRRSVLGDRYQMQWLYKVTGQEGARGCRRRALPMLDSLKIRAHVHIISAMYR